MKRLTERRLRSVIRNILREYHVTESNPKSQSMHALQIDRLIKSVCPRLKGKNIWVPVGGMSRGHVIYLEELEEIIEGIVPIVKLDPESTDFHGHQQKLFLHDPGDLDNKISEIIFAWLTGIKARVKMTLGSGSKAKVVEPYCTGYRPGGKSIKWEDIDPEDKKYHEEPNYKYYFLNICNMNEVEYHIDKQFTRRVSGAKNLVGALHKELDKLISYSAKDVPLRGKDSVYDVDQVLQGNIESSGKDFMGADWFKDEETRLQWGEYLQNEYDTKYEHEKQQAKEAGMSDEQAHRTAMGKARQLVQDYADSLYLTAAADRQS